MIKSLKKAWYNSEWMMYKSTKAVVTVTFGTSKFCVRHLGTILAVAATVGVVVAVAALKDNQKKDNGKDNEYDPEKERLRDQIRDQRFENRMLRLENAIYRSGLGESSSRRYRPSRNRRYRPSRNDDSGFSKWKQDAINWLDRKEERIKKWADGKIEECNEAYDRLSQTSNIATAMNSEETLKPKENKSNNKSNTSRDYASSSDTGRNYASGSDANVEDLPPSYEDVMRMSGYSVTPSAPRSEYSDTPSMPDVKKSEATPSAPREEDIIEEVNNHSRTSSWKDIRTHN